MDLTFETSRVRRRREISLLLPASRAMGLALICVGCPCTMLEQPPSSFWHGFHGSLWSEIEIAASSVSASYNSHYFLGPARIWSSGRPRGAFLGMNSNPPTTNSTANYEPGDGRKPPYGEGFFLRPVGARARGRQRSPFLLFCTTHEIGQLIHEPARLIIVAYPSFVESADFLSA